MQQLVEQVQVETLQIKRRLRRLRAWLAYDDSSGRLDQHTRTKFQIETARAWIETLPVLASAPGGVRRSQLWRIAGKAIAQGRDENLLNAMRNVVSSCRECRDLSPEQLNLLLPVTQLRLFLSLDGRLRRNRPTTLVIRQLESIFVRDRPLSLGRRRGWYKRIEDAGRSHGKRLLAGVYGCLDSHVAYKVDLRKSVFVSGFWRSGTTWLQQQLAIAMGAKTIFEPMCPWEMSAAKNLFPAEIPFFMPYAQVNFSNNPVLKEFLELAMRGAIRDPWVRNVRTNFKESFCDRVVIKEVRAHFCLEAISHSFNVPIVHISRDPRAVVASFLRDEGLYGHWTRPGLLKRLLLESTDGRVRHFDKWRDEILWYDTRTFIERLACYWALSELHVRTFADSNPGAMVCVSFENIVGGNGASAIGDALKTLGIAYQMRSDLRRERISPTTAVERRSITLHERVWSWKWELYPEMINKVESVARKFGLDRQLLA